MGAGLKVSFSMTLSDP